MSSVARNSLLHDRKNLSERIKELKPTEYIIPDVLEDTLGTMDNALDWKEKYSDLPGKKIGVVQGKSYEDIVQCYDYLDNVIGVDKKTYAANLNLLPNLQKFGKQFKFIESSDSSINPYFESKYFNNLLNEIIS